MAQYKTGLFSYLHQNGSGTLAERLRSHIELIQQADEAGIDYYFVAEHHFDGKFATCPSPAVVLAPAAMVTQRIKLGALGYVVPLWHPVRLAEEIIMLDELSNGRLELGLVSGINKRAFQEYGPCWDDKASLFWDGTDKLLRRLLRTLPIWHPTRDLASMLRGAKLGWNTAQWVAPRVEKVRDLFEHYKAVAPGTPNLGIMREIYVAESDSAAVQVGGPSWLKFWERFHRHKLPENIGDVAREQRGKELQNVNYSIHDNSFICGKPDAVTKQIKQLMQATGANTFLGDFAFGYLENTEVAKSFNLFTKYVLPELSND